MKIQHLERMVDCHVIHVSFPKGIMIATMIFGDVGDNDFFQGVTSHYITMIFGDVADDGLETQYTWGLETHRKPTSNRDIILVCLKSECVTWK